MDLESRFARFARRGDAQALSDVFDATSPELLRLAIRLCGDAAEAEDLVQATFVAAIEAAATYDPSRPLRPWLAGILANKARMALRDRKRVPNPASITRPPAPAPADVAADRELTAGVQRAIDSIEEPYRQVLVLHLRYGLEPAEIADALGRPPATVRTQLRRGRERLRGLLPAGLLAGLFLGLAPARGLAAVKSAVLSQIPTALLWGGVFVKNKSLVVVVVLLLLGGTVWLARDAVRTSDVAVDRAERSAARSATEAPVAPSAEAPEGQPRGPADRFGQLVVRAVNAADGAPVSGVLITVRTREPLARHLQVRPGETVGGLLPGTIDVYSESRARTQATIEAGETAEVTLRLSEGYSLCGRVVDDQGRPVQAASVCLSVWNDFESAVAVTETDAFGRFDLSGVSDSPGMVCARAHGYAPSARYYLVQRAGTMVEVAIVLREGGGDIEGMVSREDGTPLPYAVVGVRPEKYAGAAPRSPEGLMLIPNPPVFLAIADAEGRFRMSGVGEGDVRVAAIYPGLATSNVTVSVSQGATSQVTLRLGEGGVLAGRVVLREGDAVPGAGVNLYAGMLGDQRVTSDGDGAFRFEHVPEGRWQLLAQSKDHGESRIEARAGGAPVLITLAAGTVVTGRVLDADGAPLSKTWVILRGPTGEQQGNTDSDGRFKITNARDGPHDLVVFDRACPVMVPIKIVRVDPAGGDVIVQLQPSEKASAFVAGRIDGEAGDLKVTVRHVESGRAQTMTAENPFRIGPLPPGRFDLEVIVPGRAPLARHDIAVTPGETIDLGVLRPVDAGALRVRVRTEDGEALPGNACSLDDGTRKQPLTIRDGLVESGPLAPGSYRFQVKLFPYAEALVPVEIASGRTTEAEVRLRRGAWRTITFEAPPAVTSLRVIITAEGGVIVSDTDVSRNDGTLRYSPILAPGNYVVTATTVDGTRRTWDVEQGDDLDDLAPISCPFGK